jgi:hypothetical protein
VAHFKNLQNTCGVSILFVLPLCGEQLHEVRGDLIQGLRSILKKTTLDGNKLDGVIIETTGLADPAPVAQTFFADDVIQARMTLVPGQRGRRKGLKGPKGS